MNKKRMIRQQRRGPAEIPFICAATLFSSNPTEAERAVGTKRALFKFSRQANSENPENPSRKNRSRIFIVLRLVLDWTSVAFGRSKTLKLSTATAQKTGK